jgi:hypothetical protein
MAAVKTIKCEDPETLRHMRHQDIAAFAETALVYKVFIMVRRTNPAALQYIGKPGFIPKHIDCKAKTADEDVLVNGRLQEIAGLVVDPNIVGPGAYKPGKYAKALNEWQGHFKSHLAPPGTAPVTDAQRYGVQDDPSQPRYGAVVTWRNNYRIPSMRVFVHGDYDLFSIVPTGDRTSNVFVEERLLGQKHSRGKQLMDVQNYVNARMGVAMVLHGEQDHYDDSFDDTVDIFYPDGATVASRSGAALKRFFEEELGGRPLHKAGTATATAGGLWRRG